MILWQNSTEDRLRKRFGALSIVDREFVSRFLREAHIADFTVGQTDGGANWSGADCWGPGVE